VTTVWLWLGVAAAGAAGALARFAVDRVVTARTGGAFPFGTLVVNLSGSFLLGLLSAVLPPGPELLLSGTALLGSYTTFSTWMFESHRLGESGRTGGLVMNLAVSLAAGLCAVALGWAAGSLFSAGRG
jgi:CrcB protein